jgi:hypothetical protein
MVMGNYNWDELGRYLDEHWGTGFEEVDSMIAEGIKAGKSPRVARGMLRYYENKLYSLLKRIEDLIGNLAD